MALDRRQQALVFCYMLQWDYTGDSPDWQGFEKQGLWAGDRVPIVCQDFLVSPFKGGPCDRLLFPVSEILPAFDRIGKGEAFGSVKSFSLMGSDNLPQSICFNHKPMPFWILVWDFYSL